MIQRFKISFIVFLFSILVAFFIMIAINIFGMVFRKLGFLYEYAVYFLFLSVLGSIVNIPLKIEMEHSTSIAINLGGAIIPLLMSMFLSIMVKPVNVVIGILVMTTIVHMISKPVKSSGIAIHMVLPPLLAVATALIISPKEAPLIAYISGTIGCLIGIDMLNLKKLPELGVPVVSIGGAGTFDAIFLTGIISVLLA